MIPKLPRGFSHPMLIGDGAFSSVYRARQNSLDRWVAIKILKEKDPDKRSEQLKEARTQAGMQIGCVPEVFDVFEWRNQIFIIMQWVKGVALSDLINTELNREQRFWLAEGIIQAVAVLHNHGYAHRDLKPENIQVSPKDGLFLVDFGLSKDLMDNFKSFSGTVKGTPAFMAPELWLSRENVDYFRADLYAVGKVLTSVLKDCCLSEITDRLLSHNPEERPANGESLMELWKSLSNINHNSPDWNGMVSDLASINLSQNLYHAGIKLQHLKRNEEAYWLLSECLEENPNHSEAMDLMSNFRTDNLGKNNRVIWGLAAAGIILAALIMSFFLGRQKGKQETGLLLYAAVREEPAGSRLLSALGSPERGTSALPLKTDSLRIQTLSARLIITGKQPDGRLAVNDKVQEQNISGKGWMIPYGEHVLTWVNSSGNIIWREKIKLLPFQTKSIQLPSHLFENKG